MTTSRHPAYRSDALITSTEAARLLRSNPHDPLAFRRLEQLRAQGRLRPALVDSDCWYRRTDVERCARPWDYPPAWLADANTQPEPARNVWRSILIAAGIGALIWIAIGFTAWSVAR